MWEAFQAEEEHMVWLWRRKNQDTVENLKDRQVAKDRSWGEAGGRPVVGGTGLGDSFVFYHQKKDEFLKNFKYLSDMLRNKYSSD